MKIIFAGTPAFAAAALQALQSAGHTIALVLTQPDRPAGRGMKNKASAVALLAEQLGLQVKKPSTLKDPEVEKTIREVGADIMVVAAYGLILPQAILNIPKQGCVNIHASLLPRWRGAAPVQRAILAGDTKTGICIMQMEAGLDTGPVLFCLEIPIEAHETSATLFAKLTDLGALAIVRALENYDELKPRPQPAEGITHAKKLTRAEAPIDWRRPAHEVDRQVRAFNPFPGAEMVLAESTIKVWAGHPVHLSGAPGAILQTGAEGMTVACGKDALLVTELQKPGGKKLPAGEFLRGRENVAGQNLRT